MKVLLLVDCYLPSIKSAAKLMHDLSVELERQGHDVTLLAPDPSITKTKTLKITPTRRIILVKTPKIKGAPKILRALFELLLSKMLWYGAKEILNNNPHDLIVIYSPSIFFSGLAKKLIYKGDFADYV